MELASQLGESETAEICAAMLSGADPAEFGYAIHYLGKRAGVAGWPAYWPRVWGARGLLYVWPEPELPAVSDAVLTGARDEAWRVAEMCLKVSAKRDLPAAEEALALAGHEHSRVRAVALRVLGTCGEHEHVAAVRAGLDDEDETVRRAAARAVERLEVRLDLPAGLDSGA